MQKFQEQELRNAAKHGNIDAKFTLGKLCLESREFEQAMKWFDAVVAQTAEKDENNVEAYFRTAAEHGDADAQFYLGILYEGEGEDGEEGYAKKCHESAMALFHQAAEQGHFYAQMTLWHIYEEAGDREQAMIWLRKVAEQGDADAQFILALSCQFGDPDTDYDMLLKDFNEQEFIEQLEQLDEIDNRHHAEAFKWYRMAAEQGMAAAQYSVALAYDEGRGVEQDYQQALQWYFKAAEQSFSPAQAALGSMYEEGRGVIQDYGQARKWYEKAAQQGNADAIEHLEEMA